MGCKGIDIGEDATSEFCGSNRVGGIPFPVVSKVFAVVFIKDSGRPGVDDNNSGFWKFDDDGSSSLSNLVDDLFRADGEGLDGADRIESQKQQVPNPS